MMPLLRRATLALTVLVAAAGAARAQLPSDSVVRALVAQRIASGATPGIVVGLVEPDGRTRVVAVGEERPGRPLDGRSVFEIGSVSKVFTASILADMVSRGEVKLDDPVAKYLPSTVKVPERNGRQIRLLDLSMQNSGLPRLPGNMHPADPTNPYADYTVQQLYDFLSSYQLPRDVGERYEYSNLGVGLLGHALALRAGKSYDELLHERILKPLHMENTGVVLTPEMRAHLAPGHAGGREVPNWDIPTLAGAGGIRSDMVDMLKFLAANIFPDRSRLGREMEITHAIRAATTMPNVSIGLNWHVLTALGDTVVWHNGETGGYHSFVGFRPSAHTGVVVLSNSNASIDDLGLHVLDERMPVASPAPTRPHNEIALAPEALDAFVGEYRFVPTFSVVVTREGTQLFIQATGQEKVAVYPEGPNDFFLKVVDAQITFTRDTVGVVTGLVLHQNGRDQAAPKVR